ncbi:TetR/AcrR family transcriptional regulator [Mesorhizobium amorphae]|uniref:TetR family transcriptional regulator n=1 Tax=Mesorhizobium amorphae CCNWGS0123 TaxID=1082933 RepID=G6YAU9_9HYPH|nr:TetR/AcrR family transcriptional regulator [Mesorhizobium amorphae]ANT50873.1 TetR family transcriptional regulator [Mesorhizobium amorphae CCNWGS0123]EHH11100.1 TetR family transcriptional regulator [Mesorhizobium amorphae CCNWGS0123]GLR42974.1 TetR family transcriptional regulator [Mesorhizobium amorphae]
MTPSPSSGKRQHVVETAYTLFKQGGFHATGIDRIIAEADIAKMTMYRHFPSKDELIVEVLDYRTGRFDRQLDRLEQEGITAEQKIERIFDWHERWFRSADFHGCLFAHALAEFGDPGHPVFKAVARQKNGLRSRMQAILEDVMPPDRAAGAAAALLMLIEGATLMAQMGQPAIGNARKAAAAIIAAASGPL